MPGEPLARSSRGMHVGTCRCFRLRVGARSRARMIQNGLPHVRRSTRRCPRPSTAGGDSEAPSQPVEAMATSRSRSNSSSRECRKDDPRRGWLRMRCLALAVVVDCRIHQTPLSSHRSGRTAYFSATSSKVMNASVPMSPVTVTDRWLRLAEIPTRSPPYGVSC